MRRLKFPSYEYIKSLPKWDNKADLPKQYRWTLFDTPTTVIGTLSYNEDGDGFIYFDVWEGGYTGMNYLGKALKFNKANYAKICKHAQNVLDDFYRALDADYSTSWEKYEEEE